MLHSPSGISDLVRERSKQGRPTVEIPTDVDDVTIEVDGCRVALTNLRKVYFPRLGLTKGDLLRYYLSVSDALIPHVAGRAMVMKRFSPRARGRAGRIEKPFSNLTIIVREVAAKPADAAA